MHGVAGLRWGSLVQVVAGHVAVVCTPVAVQCRGSHWTGRWRVVVVTSELAAEKVFSWEVWECVLTKMCCAVLAVVEVVLSAEQIAAVCRQEVEWVLHSVVQVAGWCVKLAVLLVLLAGLLLVAHELAECWKTTDGVDVVGGGCGGQLAERSTGVARATAGGSGADEGAEYLAETRVEADSLSADQLAQGTGEFDSRVRTRTVAATTERELSIGKVHGQHTKN